MLAIGIQWEIKSIEDESTNYFNFNAVRIDTIEYSHRICTSRVCRVYVCVLEKWISNVYLKPFTDEYIRIT